MKQTTLKNNFHLDGCIYSSCLWIFIQSLFPPPVQNDKWMNFKMKKSLMEFSWNHSQSVYHRFGIISGHASREPGQLLQWGRCFSWCSKPVSSHFQGSTLKSHQNLQRCRPTYGSRSQCPDESRSVRFPWRIFGLWSRRARAVDLKYIMASFTHFNNFKTSENLIIFQTSNVIFLSVKVCQQLKWMNKYSTNALADRPHVLSSLDRESQDKVLND